MEYTHAKYETDIQNLNIYKLKLEREIDQLRSQAMGGGDRTEDYLRLCQEKNEIERQRADYEAKFSTLMDDYSVRIKLKSDYFLPPLIILNVSHD